MWQLQHTKNSRVKVILQGKLRITEPYRRRSLHVAAGLRFFLAQKLRYPLARFFMISVASLFNFVSMTMAVHRYIVLNQPASSARDSVHQLLYQVLREHVEQNGFTFATDGCINVRITLQPDVVEAYPSSYHRLPAAREYVQLNPRWREGHDLAYAYEFALLNVFVMLWRLLKHHWRMWRQENPEV